jgi:membrane protease YdiL (CAAX protease family)
VFFVKILLSVDSASRGWYADCTSVFMIISALAGLALFIYWAVKNKFGKNSLDKADFRANFMPYYLPFAVIFCWVGLTWFASNLAENLTAQLPDWQQKFTVFSFLIVIEIVIIVFILAAAKKYFEGGLNSFGLRRREIFRDIAAAAAYFIAVWPLVLAAIYLIIIIGRLIQGPDFQMQQNEGLAVILENEQWSLRLLMIFFATILTPVFEEVIFRGLLQSYFRDIGYSPWQAIFIASIIFSVLHPWMHLPALLILAVCMGYAYEKSGSLFRSIFIHSFFNASMIAFALLG